MFSFTLEIRPIAGCDDLMALFSVSSLVTSEALGAARFPAVITAGGKSGCKVQEVLRNASCDTD
jgi:hypothetical protein